MVHSHLRFSQLFCEPELIVEQWVTLYYMGAFTPGQLLHGLKSSIMDYVPIFCDSVD